MTWRQYAAWCYWLAEDYNTPRRSDHYLMRIAAEVRRSWVKHKSRVKDTDFRCTFEGPGGKSETLSPEERARKVKLVSEISKAKWMHIAGPGAVYTPPPGESDNGQEPRKVGDMFPDMPPSPYLTDPPKPKKPPKG